MKVFDIGETVICSIEIRDSGGVLKDPAISVRVEGYNKNRDGVVASTQMTQDATGKYHYDLATANIPEGLYTLKCTAIDGSRITILKVSFMLE